MNESFDEFRPFDNWIPKTDMVVGAKYLCRARNFDVGVWNGESFDYMRTKFTMTFPDTELHWDEGAPFGTAKPFQLWEKP